MEESADEAAHREDVVRMYHATKEALRVIGDVTSSTVTTPAPPPVDNDWIKVTPSDSHLMQRPDNNGFVWHTHTHYSCMMMQELKDWLTAVSALVLTYTARSIVSSVYKPPTNAVW